MRTVWVVLLTILALAVGSAIGLIVGVSVGAYTSLQTNIEVGCAVLRTAESAGHLSKEKRKQLVDSLLEELKEGDKQSKQSESDRQAMEQIVGWARDRLDCAGS